MSTPQRCDTCSTSGLVIIATARGWSVRCSDGHEVFPMEGRIITAQGKTTALGTKVKLPR